MRDSKLLSRILRHDAEELGLTVRPDGSVSVNEVLGLPVIKSKRWTVSDIYRIIEHDCNDKSRFFLIEEENADGTTTLFISANQGHSHSVGDLINDEELLTRLTPFDIFLAVHGSYYKAWRKILKLGLSRMTRKMIHFAGGLPGETCMISGRPVIVSSGMRRDAEIHVWIDLALAIRAGVLFYISRNNVILTPGSDGTGILQMFYVLRVVDAKTGRVIWENELFCAFLRKLFDIMDVKKITADTSITRF